jgi:hypothetical protein
VKKKTPVKKSTEQKGNNKQTQGAGKKPTGKNKKVIVTPSITDAVLNPTLGTKRSLLWWLGGDSDASAAPPSIDMPSDAPPPCNLL